MEFAFCSQSPFAQHLYYNFCFLTWIYEETKHSFWRHRFQTSNQIHWVLPASKYWKFNLCIFYSLCSHFSQSSAAFHSSICFNSQKFLQVFFFVVVVVVVVFSGGKGAILLRPYWEYHGCGPASQENVHSCLYRCHLIYWGSSLHSVLQV